MLLSIFIEQRIKNDRTFQLLIIPEWYKRFETCPNPIQYWNWYSSQCKFTQTQFHSLWNVFNIRKCLSRVHLQEKNKLIVQKSSSLEIARTNIRSREKQLFRSFLRELYMFATSHAFRKTTEFYVCFFCFVCSGSICSLFVHLYRHEINQSNKQQIIIIIISLHKTQNETVSHRICSKSIMFTQYNWFHN